MNKKINEYIRDGRISIDLIRHCLLQLKVFNDISIYKIDEEIDRLLELDNIKLMSKFKDEFSKWNGSVMLQKTSIFKKLNIEKKEYTVREIAKVTNIFVSLFVILYININIPKIAEEFTIKSDSFRDTSKKSSFRNFGNILVTPRKILCKNSDDEIPFYPIYEDWLKQWEKYVRSNLREIKRLAHNSKNAEYKRFAIKIDFEDAYNNLNRSDFSATDGIKYLKDLIDIKFIDEEEKEVAGVPFGGVPFAHPIANILLLEKRKKIFNAFRRAGFMIDAFITYADDSVLYVTIPADSELFSDDLFNAISKQLYWDDVADFVEKKNCNHSNNFWSPLKINTSKTEVFNLNSSSDIAKLKDSFYAVYSLTGMVKASKKFDDQNIEILGFSEVNSLDRTNNLVERQKLLNKINGLERLIKYREVSEIIEEIFSIKNASSLLVNLIEIFYSKGKINEFVCLFSKKIRTLNGEWSVSEKGFILGDMNSPFLTYVKSLLLDVSNSSHNLKYIVDQVLNDLFEIKNSFSCEKIIGEANGELDKEKMIIENGLNKIIKKYSNKPNEYLRKMINIISPMQECDYKEIKLEFIYMIEENDTINNYFQKTKINLLKIIKALFLNTKTVLYERFKRAVIISENRIELINNMKYLHINKDISEINDMLVSVEEKEVFEIMASLINSYKNTDTFKKVDNAIVSRMGVKLLWSNGSPSMHSYTMHNHKHGDAILIKYFEIWKNSISFRRFQQEGIDEYVFILSCYYHDIGMLKDMPYQTSFSTELGTIRAKIGNYIRVHHHKESGSILRDAIGKLFGLSFNEINDIDYVARFHGQAEDTLPDMEDKSVKNAAITLSLLDNFDITKNRSPILPRLVTSNSSARNSFLHWIKHLSIESIKWSEFKDNIDIIIEVNKNIISVDSLNWNNYISFLINNEFKWIYLMILRYHKELNCTSDIAFRIVLVDGIKKEVLQMVDGKTEKISSFFTNKDVDNLSKINFVSKNEARLQLSGGEIILYIQ